MSYRSVVKFVGFLMDGKIVGAIGMSGGTSQQDGQCANVGAAAVK